MGAWLAWLNFLKRLRESDEKRREENRVNMPPDMWRRGKDYNADMKDWRG